MKSLIVIEKILLFAFVLIVVLSMNSVALAHEIIGKLDHRALATKFEQIAKEMQTKADRQKNILKNKPRSSFLGRTGMVRKKRINTRIRQYTKVAAENLAYADFHLKMAEIANQKKL